MECAIATDWVLDEKVLRAGDYFIESQIFETFIPGVQFFIRIYPCDDEDEVYLCFHVKTETKVIADFTLSVPSARFLEKSIYTFSPEDDEYEILSVTSNASLFDPKSGFIQNGKLTIQLRGTLKSDENNGIKSGDTLGQIFWKNDDDKDFTIQVDDGEIKAHKFILRERSPYFAGMFDSGMKEARENKVKIEGFPLKIVDAAVKICYDFKDIDFLFTEDLLLMLKLSDVYDIAAVKACAEQHLAKFLHYENVCRIANASIEFHADKLRLCCMLFLFKCSKDSTPLPNLDFLDDGFKLEFANKVLCQKI